MTSRMLQRTAFLRPAISFHRISQQPKSRFAALASNHRTTGFIMSNPHCAFSTDFKMPSPPTSNHPHSKLATAKGSLVYTETDEAPALATYSLLPILKKVC